MSKIEWTDVTWNPLSGCTRVSEGCRHCYAEKMSGRLEAMGQERIDKAKREGKTLPESSRLAAQKYDGAAKDGKWTGDIRFHPEVLDAPLKWRKPRRVFVCSMSDLFHPDVEDEWRIAIFDIFRRCHNERGHIFQVLTKRPSIMADFCQRLRFSGSANDGKGRTWLSDRPEHHDGGWGLMGGSPGSHPLSNVWLGTSVEDQATADERIPHLLQCPAAVRFVSYEPALGPVDFDIDIGHGVGDLASDNLNWIIAGGESGPNWRAADPEWFRSVRDQCKESGVAFFMKQMAGKRPIPEDLIVRQWP